MAKLKLLEALDGCTEEDLAAVRDRIDALKAELQTLEMCERVLLKKFPPAAPEGGEATTAREATGFDRETFLNRAHDLITQRGPLTSKQIGEALGIPYTNVGRVLRKSDWFRTDGRLWRVTIAGE